MAVITVTRNYQITLPEDVRKKKDIKEGERLVVKLNDKGDIVVEKLKESIASKTFGRWRGEAPGVEYVDSIRTGWNKRREASIT